MQRPVSWECMPPGIDSAICFHTATPIRTVADCAPFMPVVYLLEKVLICAMRYSD